MFKYMVLDSYQRAYVWTEERVIQLLEDFGQFITAQSSSLPGEYYLGAILLHQKQGNDCNTFSVVDGQQRLTTLAILHWVLNGALPEFIHFEFRSPHSFVNVQKAKNVMQSWLQQRQIFCAQLNTIFASLRLTVITVKREDLAFTFFDTQNNRGVPLGSTDLLKAYHLRAIQGDNISLVEQLQSLCARKWEQVQQRGNFTTANQGYDFAHDLFHYYLWRGRNWRGSDVKELANREEILTHFGEQSRKSGIGLVTLYPAGANQWGQNLELLPSNDYLLTPALQHCGYQAAHLPFALRQPISRGVGFFLYAEKYAALLQLLLFSEAVEPEIKATQKFYKCVVCTLSPYLQHLFRLALLTYYDRLGSYGLLRFALYLDHSLGAIRLTQADVRRETPVRFLRDAKRNLLDVIAHAYECDEVICFLNQGNNDKAYALNDGWQEEILNSGSRVQERYVTAVAHYYGLLNLSVKKALCMDEKVKTELFPLKESSNAGPDKMCPHE
ncbi:DUF262 domain-containing protein [Pectobacterium brasiliense]|nr:DUF262 domain-containing protein [Pectobacterium brasiliense]